MVGYYGTVTTLSKVQGYRPERSRKIPESDGRRNFAGQRSCRRARAGSGARAGRAARGGAGCGLRRRPLCAPSARPRSAAMARGCFPNAHCNKNDLLEIQTINLSPRAPSRFAPAVSPFLPRPPPPTLQNLEVEKFAGYTLWTLSQLSPQMRLFKLFNYTIIAYTPPPPANTFFLHQIPLLCPPSLLITI